MIKDTPGCFSMLILGLTRIKNTLLGLITREPTQMENMLTINRSTRLKNAPLLTTKDVARRWAVSVSILKQWRGGCKGPRYVKVANSVRYYLDDLEQYEKEHGIQHTAMR